MGFIVCLRRETGAPPDLVPVGRLVRVRQQAEGRVAVTPTPAVKRLLGSVWVPGQAALVSPHPSNHETLQQLLKSGSQVSQQRMTSGKSQLRDNDCKRLTQGSRSPFSADHVRAENRRAAAAPHLVHPVLLHAELPSVAVRGFWSRFKLLLLEGLVFLKNVLSQLVYA